jgi:NADH:ubiquinone oxidoreductase subunit 3 (subunit A)
LRRITRSSKSSIPFFLCNNILFFQVLKLAMFLLFLQAIRLKDLLLTTGVSLTVFVICCNPV